jgi:hypothetical protein
MNHLLSGVIRIPKVSIIKLTVNICSLLIKFWGTLICQIRRTILADAQMESKNNVCKDIVHREVKLYE